MEHEVLRDLNLHGAEHWEIIVSQYGHDDMLELVRTKYLRTLDTPAGIVAVLGPKGRKLFGGDPSYIPKATPSASQVLRRHVIRGLENHGWEFDDYFDDLGVFCMMQDEQIVFVYVNWYDPSVQTVRKFLQEYSVFKTLVGARKTAPYQTLQAEYPRFNLLELDLNLPPRSV
jgi:hypothetical protein